MQYTGLHVSHKEVSRATSNHVRLSPGLTDFRHERSRAMSAEILRPRLVVTLKTETDSTYRRLQSLQWSGGVGSTSPDSPRARLSLHFVSWRRGSPRCFLPGPSSLPPLRLKDGSPVSTSRLRSRTPSARLTRGPVLACHVGRRVEVVSCQSPRPR